MRRTNTSLRSALGRVKGLGSAKEGTEHWVQQRVTAITLIFLCLYVMGSFFTYVVFGNYQTAVTWLRSPFTTTFIILFLVAGFWHSVLGLQVVIEDYVQSPVLKWLSLLSIKFICATFAVFGIVAAVTIPLQNLIQGILLQLQNPPS
ncbi:MAG: succinate dehydrogenase, hydrophobic membrane anchor protein [Pseudomonadota bacterium]|nr:succinate dehydrogenase, hydrophobic membrane anchor protein [Pseudomonadota bacterium]